MITGDEMGGAYSMDGESGIFDPSKPYVNVNYSLAQQPNVSQGRLILEVYRSHTMTHHSR